MGTKYICPHCETEVVLVNSGGVSRSIICVECNAEMDHIERVDTEYVGHKQEDTYRIVDND